MTHITTNTTSGAASSSFTSGIDSTYKLYIFKYYDVNPASASGALQFQGSIDGGSNYNVTMTSTFFRARHNENDDETGLDYMTGYDRPQNTGFQWMSIGTSADADASLSGELYLFNPSNTTYVKHFYGTTSEMGTADPTAYAFNSYYAGYFNNTNDIDAVQFTVGGGNFDAVIKMYGVG